MSTPAVAPRSTAGRDREFAFSDDDFRSLRDLVRQITGITLSDAKRELVYGRLSRRLRVLNLESFRDYRDLLAGPDAAAEIGEFVNAVTTNLTSFFRENHHFDYLRSAFLEPLVAAGARGRRVRIWSAGCSSGEEPYSIAMTVAEALPEWKRYDIRILATDLDTEMVARGTSGIYREDRVQGMDPKRLARWFKRGSEQGRTVYEIDSDLREMISFRQLNLMHPLPMQGPLDVVFCRNVIIYFDKDTQRDLFQRIAPLQRPGALLFLGHSESLFKVSDDYNLIGKTIYRRNDTL
jgi:chemotaxis protein methyltransferase CheR